MSLFILLVGKLIPLYLLILAGFVAGRKIALNKETVARLLIYVVVPVVVFQGTLTAEITGSLLLLPLIMFALCFIMAMLLLWIGGTLWNDARKNLLVFAACMGNTGYFGLPMILALLGEKVLPLIVMCIIAVIFFENTVAYYIIARGKHTILDSFKKLIRLPALYTFLLGLGLNFFDVVPNEQAMEFFRNFRGVYTVLGMMLVGLAMAGQKHYRIDFSFIAASFAGKFILWPLLAFGFSILNTRWLHLLDPTSMMVIQLLSLVPLAANTIAYATDLELDSQKAAITVFLSTLFALIFIPLAVPLIL